MNDGQLTLFPKWLERRERRMQAEEAIQIDDRLTRNIDARPHRVILRLGVGHHNVQAVGRSPLENHDQALGARPGLRSAPRGASQKAWHGRRADNGECAIAKKYATSDGHKKSLFAFGS